VLGLCGLIIQDRFHGLELGRTWLVVVLVLLGAACAVFVGTWEPVATRIASVIPLRVVMANGASGDDRPVSVRIDRDPVWHNFNYEAYIAEVHVVITNQTDGDIEVAGFQWLGTLGSAVSQIEVMREKARYERQRPQLGRHSVIEPGASESGWVVVAVPFNAGDPELPSLGVKVSGYRDPFEAWQ
jgi:hypothetical protein